MTSFDDASNQNETIESEDTQCAGKGNRGKCKRKNKKGKKQTRVADGDNVYAAAIAKNSGYIFCKHRKHFYEQIDGREYTIKDEMEASNFYRDSLTGFTPSFNSGKLASVFNLGKSYSSERNWCTDPNMLPMANGVFDMAKQTLESYKYTHPFNWRLTFDYDKDAVCSETEHILLKMAGGDKKVYAFLLYILCAILFSWNHLQKYFELVGPGGTGKSTFINIAQLLVGMNNVVSTDINLIENDKFEMVNLSGKKLAVMSDSKQRVGGDNANFKMVVGGDLLPCHIKHEKSGKPFRFPGIVLIATNYALQSSDHSSGESRRRVVVPFAERVTDADRERYPDGVEVVIEGELPGLLNLLLSIDKKKAEHALQHPPRAVAAYMLKTQFDTNPILAFANEHLVLCGKGEEPSYIGGAINSRQRETSDTSSESLIYPRFQSYCESLGKHPISLIKFSEYLIDQLNTKGINTKKQRNSKGNYLTGLRLRTRSDIKSPNLISRKKNK